MLRYVSVTPLNSLPEGHVLKVSAFGLLMLVWLGDVWVFCATKISGKKRTKSVSDKCPAAHRNVGWCQNLRAQPEGYVTTGNVRSRFNCMSNKGHTKIFLTLIWFILTSVVQWQACRTGSLNSPFPCLSGQTILWSKISFDAFLFPNFFCEASTKDED